ncbi:MAG: ABC transporter ATP-binding protein [Phycisphaerales bacterium]|nr:MAG: ABC transporter ATP-binding protein [Phycisphaerales bacterium]
MSRSSRHRFAEYRGSPEVPRARDGSELPPVLGAPAGRGRWAPLREYARWLAPHRAGILLVFVLATVSALLSLIPPYATKWIVDTVLTDEAVEHGRRIVRLHTVGAAVLLLLVIQQAFEAWRGYRMAVLNARIVQRVRQKLYNHLLRLPLGKIYHLRTGGVVTHLSNDVDEVSSLLQMGLITPGVAILRVVLTVVMLFHLQWKMALVACALIPPIILVNLFWVRRIRPIYRSMRADRAAANARVAETFGGIRVVRAFLRERSEAREYAAIQHTIIRKNVFAHILQLVVTIGWGLLIPLCSLVIIWYGGTRYLAGETTIGSIIAFQMYIFMLLYPISQIVNSYSQLQRAMASMERIYDLLSEPVDKPDRPGAADLPQPLRSVRFDKVSFGYDPQRLVVRDLTFSVHAGQTVALVGPSGAGKTTITNLVARFYDPTAGAIFINDVDLRDIRLQSFRCPLGIVEQEVFLFDGTIRQNIAYGRRSATADQIVEAAKRANAHEFVIGFPGGYDTMIGERGVKLSGGQRQRLSIARAILADPQILILDEATSNLDTESEQLIQAALEDLLANRTTFVIAHRLSTIRHADLILVLQDGRIVESGEHETLMAGDTFYREMIERQMYREAYGAPATLET